jgi:hypothetical protein
MDASAVLGHGSAAEFVDALLAALSRLLERHTREHHRRLRSAVESHSESVHMPAARSARMASLPAGFHAAVKATVVQAELEELARDGRMHRIAINWARERITAGELAAGPLTRAALTWRRSRGLGRPGCVVRPVRPRHCVSA